jgi:hypothetical protein
VARPTSDVVSVTAYQLRGSVDPATQVREKYRDDPSFTVHDVTVGTRRRTLVEGAKPAGQTRWAATVGHWTGTRLDTDGNVTPGASYCLPAPTRPRPPGHCALASAFRWSCQGPGLMESIKP